MAALDAAADEAPLLSTGLGPPFSQTRTANALKSGGGGRAGSAHVEDHERLLLDLDFVSLLVRGKQRREQIR